MTPVPPISEAEWKVMKALWTKSPQPAYDIAQALAESEQWHPNTVKTLLGRLHRKKVVGFKRYKNLYLYSPLFTEAQCIAAESEGFLQRVFGGAVGPLLVHFAKKEKLSKSELESLRSILNPPNS